MRRAHDRDAGAVEDLFEDSVVLTGLAPLAELEVLAEELLLEDVSSPSVATRRGLRSIRFPLTCGEHVRPGRSAETARCATASARAQSTELTVPSSKPRSRSALKSAGRCRTVA